MEGQEVLRDVKVNDVIKSVKVVSGADKLVNSTARKSAAAAGGEAAVGDAAASIAM